MVQTLLWLSAFRIRLPKLCLPCPGAYRLVDDNKRRGIAGVAICVGAYDYFTWWESLPILQ